jgi:perosamine synthetase
MTEALDAPIRLSVPSIEEDDLDAVRSVLKTGFLVQGPRVAAFEATLCELTDSKFAVALTNCTAALQLALLAIDVRPGDLVLVTAYSWISTANAIELCGATPIFVDIDERTFNMSPEALSARLATLKKSPDTWRRVRAVLPVHTFGQMADMTQLSAIAEAHGLVLIEDAACALGGQWHGKKASGIARMGCLSFHPRKAVTTGEGGAITTNDAELAARLRALRNHGLDPFASSPDFIMPGFNCRMTEFQAAMGSTQLAKLERVLGARRTLAKHYDALLAKTAVAPPYVAAEALPTYQSYVAMLPVEVAPRRAQIIAQLKTRGVETNIGTWHMPMTTFFRTRYHFGPGDFPVTDRVFAGALTLPLYEGLTPERMGRVVSELCTALG